MSFKKALGFVAFGSAVTIAIYGAGCGGSGSGTGGAAGKGGAAGGGGGGGTMGTGMGGAGGAGGGGGSGGSPFEGGDAGGACDPGSLTGFTPAMNASAISAGACTATMISNIINDCFPGANPDASAGSACTDLLGDAATKQCFTGCITTNWTSASSGVTYTTTPWGGLLYSLNPGELEFIDFGACISLSEPSNMAAQTCAKDEEESLECILQACLSNCPIPMETGECSADPACVTAENAFDDCYTAAAKGECMSYSTAINTDCATVTADSGPLADCLSAISVLTSTSSPSPAEVSKALNQYLDIICLAGGIPDGGGD